MPRKPSNGKKQPAPLSVGKYVDRVQELRSERESAVDRVRSEVERKFRERESRLLERVPEEKRMTAQAALEAAEEQRRAGRSSAEALSNTAVREALEPPV